MSASMGITDSLAKTGSVSTQMISPGAKIETFSQRDKWLSVTTTQKAEQSGDELRSSRGGRKGDHKCYCGSDCNHETIIDYYLTISPKSPSKEAVSDDTRNKQQIP